jgi:hypothetical protein
MEKDIGQLLGRVEIKFLAAELEDLLFQPLELGPEFG